MTQRDRWKRRECVVRYRLFADELRLIAGRVPPAETVERLDWLAVFPMPASWSRKKRAAHDGTIHRSKPDRDNIDKAILDALYPGCDQGIGRGTIEKIWGLSGRLVISITTE